MLPCEHRWWCDGLHRRRSWRRRRKVSWREAVNSDEAYKWGLELDVEQSERRKGLYLGHFRYGWTGLEICWWVNCEGMRVERGGREEEIGGRT